MEERASDSVKNLYSSYATNLPCDLNATVVLFFSEMQHNSILNRGI